MTDAEHAAVLCRTLSGDTWLNISLLAPEERAAIERAIDALAECERLRVEVDGLLDELSRCQCERVGES